jgi:hypothetical protein
MGSKTRGFREKNAVLPTATSMANFHERKRKNLFFSVARTHGQSIADVDGRPPTDSSNREHSFFTKDNGQQENQLAPAKIIRDGQSSAAQSCTSATSGKRARRNPQQQGLIGISRLQKEQQKKPRNST